ncbi:MAG: DUF1573 domain-containing protein [Candidatus Omnitrophica bacterium]|nr:DUF1573 domain-containing protein [Candidatus Omnitrophota bacterium]MDD5553824.1 DUF1573 domain-containing protein [Candidatus Omnitrophota bacterium]
MRSLILILIFLSLPLGGCYSNEQAGETGQAPGPGAETGPDTWDFGQVKEGQVFKHAFALKNEFEIPLTIKDVNTSCGCTVSQAKDKVIAPGESTSIDVKFNSKGYSGSVQQFVYVHTDNLDKPIVRFIIKADVIK